MDYDQELKRAKQWLEKHNYDPDAEFNCGHSKQYGMPSCAGHLVASLLAVYAEKIQKENQHGSAEASTTQPPQLSGARTGGRPTAVQAAARGQH